jgi:hypothetical protein
MVYSTRCSVPLPILVRLTLLPRREEHLHPYRSDVSDAADVINLIGPYFSSNGQAEVV